MPLFVQSSFLQALGLAIANSLWQMGLIWLMYQVITGIAKPTAAARYALASAAALSGTLWFLLSWWYYFQIPVPIDSGMVMLASQQPGGWLWRSISAIRLMMPYLGGAYLLVVAVLAIRLYNSFSEVHSLRHSGLSKAPVDWRLFVKKYSALLHIEKPVTLLLSSSVSSPLTLGFWKPVILLPVASINQLSAEQLEAVLLHELTHIRRHDYLINLFLQVAEMLLFFNPFMRSLLKHAYNERENSCDDWVLQFNYDPRTYAAALLTIEQQAQKHVLALCATGHKQQQFHLLQRIRRMVAPEKNAFNYRSQMGMLAMLVVFGLLAHSLVGTRLAKSNAQAITVPSPTPLRKISTDANRPFNLSGTMALFGEIGNSIRASNQQIQQVATLRKEMPATTLIPNADKDNDQETKMDAEFSAIGHPVVIQELATSIEPEWTTTIHAAKTLTNANRTFNATMPQPTEKSGLAHIKLEVQGLDEASLITLNALTEQLAVLEIEKQSLETAVAKAQAEIRKMKVVQANTTLIEKEGTWTTPSMNEMGTAATMKKEAIKEWQQHMEMVKQQLKSVNDQSAAMLEQQLNTQQEFINLSLQDEIMVREKAIQAIGNEIERLTRPLITNELKANKGTRPLQAITPKKGVHKPRVIIQL